MSSRPTRPAVRKRFVTWWRAANETFKEMFSVSRWSLRGKMVLATVGLLTGVCFVVGFVCYASMSLSLNAQLNNNLNAASAQISLQVSQGAEPGRYVGVPFGTLTAVVHGGQLDDRSPSISARTTGTFRLTQADVDELVTLKPTDKIVNRAFSFGDYRLVAVSDGRGGTIITGVPTSQVDKPLAALLFTILAVSAAGIIAMGLVATAIIRRAMEPLNQLALLATRVSKLPLDEGEVKLAERAPASAANDSTEVGTVGVALNRMLDNVASALQSRQRSETKVRRFVADASHELRTPLTAIRGYTEMIKMTEDLSPSGEKSLGRVESQAKRMSAMVEDLLTLARLDEGRPLELKDVEMTQIVVETVNDLKVGLRDHQWKLNIPSQPFIVRADSGAIRQVLTNLLANAAKHTDSGSTITTSLELADAQTVRMVVHDNGPGIEAEFQEHIFDRFARADAARSGHDGTTGLGLSIVHATVMAHGGTISVQSKPGDTSFIVDLPRAADAFASTERTTEPTTQPDATTQPRTQSILKATTGRLRRISARNMR